LIQTITLHTRISVINIRNLATCFGSLNHPQTSSQNKVLLHSASVRTRWM